jgi:hypothetical protein
MRPTFSVDLQESLELAARKLRENGCGILPVTRDGFLEGVMTETNMVEALAKGMAMTDPVEGITQGGLTAMVSATGAEALRLFDTTKATALVVIDDGGRVLGILTPSDLYPKRLVPPRPPMVGGMATPFGVYLTTGSIRAGVGHLALVTTGMTMISLFTVATIISMAVGQWLTKHNVSPQVCGVVESALPILLFLVGMRSIPLSGTHAAEHKVVHAIERGEDLVPTVVRRMPRVHPRCGTNIAVGAMLFMGISNSGLLPGDYGILSPVIAVIATLMLWRPLGNAMQFYVTTKRPTDKQLAMGIQSGRELLEKYATAGTASANTWQRIVNSGMLHVVCGSLIAGLALRWIAGLLHLPLPF